MTCAIAWTAAVAMALRAATARAKARGPTLAAARETILNDAAPNLAATAKNRVARAEIVRAAIGPPKNVVRPPRRRALRRRREARPRPRHPSPRAMAD